MAKLYTFIILFIFSCQISTAQFFTQYFDGADTSIQNSILIETDTSVSNVWQIGHPQKIIFDSAATAPNAIVTDTLNYYPVNDTSRFTFKVFNQFWWGILAIQWLQKLDIDSSGDLGTIEFSIDHGLSWQNAFNNAYVYNFYGFDTANVDTLPSGEIGFSGTDSSWKNIWLCFDLSWMSTFPDTVLARFSLLSDSVNSEKEGWLIDNMMSSITLIHTIKERDQENYLNVYPNPAGDIVHVEARKVLAYHIIEDMELVNSTGELVKKWTNVPTKFWFDTGKFANGMYYLKVKTNIQSETIPLLIQR